MKHNVCNFEYDEFGGTSALIARTTGHALQHDHYINKGTAFSLEERDRLGLNGALPPSPRNLASQVTNSAAKVRDKEDDIERYIYIRALFDRNVTLAHALIASDLSYYMRIIYTPTVGLVCQRYSNIFRSANGIHFYPGNIDQAEEILARYIYRDIRVAVVTDNEGILGIGDQGTGGIAICLGKLMLYTQGAGIAPWHCLPISLDIGTDNPDLLADKEYLGWRHPRLTGQAYLDFVGAFSAAFKKVFPHALCQWEDFSRQNAFAIRDSYVDEMISFNDDIQGTGAVTLAAVLAAMRIKKESLTEQTFLVHGAGAGGVGIAEQIHVALCAEGLSAEEAAERIFTTDSRGVVTNRPDLPPYKKKFAKERERFPWLAGAGPGDVLLTAIKEAGVTVLIGTSGQAGSFTREISEAMLANTARPVILPLSNPTAKCEATPEQLIHWTKGRALVATGSPFAPVTYNNTTFPIGQCNNVFVFPGVGLGIIGSGATTVLPSFFTAAAHAVAAQVNDQALARGELLPNVHQLRQVSLEVAVAVGMEAITAGVAPRCCFSRFAHQGNPERLRTLLVNMRWQPDYLPVKSRLTDP
ncbi:MAG: NAD-dependent malic enzyme [Desulfobulbaceae bacterium]|nr:MAG: NAD-dependent malic enzyme [Desulfobulbaceae bacterium]